MNPNLSSKQFGPSEDTGQAPESTPANAGSPQVGNPMNSANPLLSAQTEPQRVASLPAPQPFDRSNTEARSNGSWVGRNSATEEASE